MGVVTCSTSQDWDGGGRKGMAALGSPPGLVGRVQIRANSAHILCRSESAFEKANVDVFRVRTNNVGLIYKIR